MSPVYVSMPAVFTLCPQFVSACLLYCDIMSPVNVCCVDIMSPVCVCMSPVLTLCPQSMLLRLLLCDMMSLVNVFCVDIMSPVCPQSMSAVLSLYPQSMSLCLLCWHYVPVYVMPAVLTLCSQSTSLCLLFWHYVLKHPSALLTVFPSRCHYVCWVDIMSPVYTTLSASVLTLRPVPILRQRVFCGVIMSDCMSVCLLCWED